LNFRRRLWQLAFWIAIVSATSFALVPSPPSSIADISDIVLHLSAFLVLTFLLAMAHLRRRQLWCAGLMFLYGAGLEVTQGLLGTRVAEWKDLGVDVAGITMGLVVLHFAGDGVDGLLQTVLRAVHLEK
jgi:VanZ family protein